MGKRNTEKLCKIWLEPNVELAAQGDLSNAQVKEVLRIANEYRDKLLKQWALFKAGKTVGSVDGKR